MTALYLVPREIEEMKKSDKCICRGKGFITCHGSNELDCAHIEIQHFHLCVCRVKENKADNHN